MLSDLEDLVARLHECLTGPQFSEESRAIVSDILYTCGENMKDQTISKIQLY